MIARDVYYKFKGIELELIGGAEEDEIMADMVVELYTNHGMCNRLDEILRWAGWIDRRNGLLTVDGFDGYEDYIQMYEAIGRFVASAGGDDMVTGQVIEALLADRTRISEKNVMIQIRRCEESMGR